NAPATKSTPTFATVNGSCPSTCDPVTHPCRPVARPPPEIRKIEAGLTPPGCPPTPLVKLEVVTCGPGSRTVSVNDVEKLPTAAFTVTVPGVAPACTVIVARPCASVVAVAPPGNNTPPLEVNCAWAPATGPCALFTWTTRGWAKVVFWMAL